MTGRDNILGKIAMCGNKDKDLATSNKYVQWYSLLAELNSYYLLCNKFGLKVVEYESSGNSSSADYLMCCIPFWRKAGATFSDYVKTLFDDFELQKPNFAVSKDPTLGALSGLILFTKSSFLNNNFIVIANVNVTPKIKDWLDIVP